MLVSTPELISLIHPCCWLLIHRICKKIHVAVLQGSVPNKFYVHNDIFRYEDEVFGDSEGELDEGEKNCTRRVCLVLVPLACMQSFQKRLEETERRELYCVLMGRSNLGGSWGREYRLCCWNYLQVQNILWNRGRIVVPHSLKGWTGWGWVRLGREWK